MIAPPAKDNLPVWGQPSDVDRLLGHGGRQSGGRHGVRPPVEPKGELAHAGLRAERANPFGRDESGFPSQKGKTELVKIDKGGEMKLKYAVYVHTGDAKAGKVAEAYELFKK